MKNVLGICGSPRAGGNSEWLLRATLNALPSGSVRSEVLLLSQAHLALCRGCLSCEDKHACPVDDDMRQFLPRMLASDLILFATPAYFDGIPGLLKNFIDRTNIIVDKLEGKSVGIIVVGQADEASWTRAVDNLRAYCDIVKMRVLETFFVKARQEKDAAASEGIAEKCAQFAGSLLAGLRQESRQ
jgi:multimeric flavodoxin WrbA